MRKVVVLCCVLYQTLYSDTHRNSSACNHFLFLITVKMSEAEGRSHLIRLPSSVKWRGCGSSPQDLRHQITLFARLIITSWNQTWQRFSTRPGSPDSRTQLAPRFTSFLGLGFVSFMGYVLLEKWSSSRIQPPKKKKQLEKSQPSTHCVLLWRQMNKCHMKKKEFSLTQLDTVAWNFKCDTVTHSVNSQSQDFESRFLSSLLPLPCSESAPLADPKSSYWYFASNIRWPFLNPLLPVATIHGQDTWGFITNPYDLGEQMAREIT